MSATQSALICEVTAARDAMADAVLALRTELWCSLELTCETHEGEIDLKSVPADAIWIKHLAQSIRKIERIMGPTKDDCPAWLDSYLSWHA